MYFFFEKVLLFYRNWKFLNFLLYYNYYGITTRIATISICKEHRAWVSEPLLPITF